MEGKENSLKLSGMQARPAVRCVSMESDQFSYEKIPQKLDETAQIIQKMKENVVHWKKKRRRVSKNGISR